MHDLEYFKACNCGLCHSLGRGYGASARFVLSFELLFLSMLLWDGSAPPVITSRRCIASPFKKKHCCSGTQTLDMCAGYNVILTWWKLRDSVKDATPIGTIPYRLALLLLHRAYRKAAKEYESFDRKVGEDIQKLDAYESQNGRSLDRAADSFSHILTATIPRGLPDDVSRPLSELLYHLGRWIYIIDACDDLKDDLRAGRYNPVSARFDISSGGHLDGNATERLTATLAHSNNLLCSAFELLPENAWSNTIRNIIYIGMPDVSSRVLRGDWPPKRRKSSSERLAN